MKVEITMISLNKINALMLFSQNIFKDRYNAIIQQAYPIEKICQSIIISTNCVSVVSLVVKHRKIKPQNVCETTKT